MSSASRSTAAAAGVVLMTVVLACLADLSAVAVLADWDYDQLEDVYIPAQIPPGPAPIDGLVDEATGANVITVSSGWGDGVYPTFVGFAADGTICGFVTDFLVIPSL